jgi:hypothetical protein
MDFLEIVEFLDFSISTEPPGNIFAEDLLFTLVGL